MEFEPSILQQLDIKSFTWAANSGTPGVTDFGLIAEDVAVVSPLLVNYRKARRPKVTTDPKTGEKNSEWEEFGKAKPYSLRTQSIAMLAVAEIQALTKRVTALGG